MSELTFKPIRREVSSITNAQPAVVTTTEDHGYFDGLYVRFSFFENFGMTQLESNFYEVLVLTDDTFAIPVNSTSFDPFVSGEADISGITKAAMGVISVSSDQFVAGQAISIAEVGGMTEINNRILRIVSVATGTITVNLNTSSYSDYTSGGVVRTVQRPQVVPIAEVSATLANAERNNLTPVGE